MNASIVIASHNSCRTLRNELKAMLGLEFEGDFEVVVADDFSTDGTREMLEKEFSKNKKIKIILLPRSGVCKARNAGIRAAKFEVVVNMDHDCVPEKDWLQKMVEPFKDKRIGVVSAFGAYGGTSTAFRADVLKRIGGYDEEYFYYREDSDLTFKIMEQGLEYKMVDAKFLHDHVQAKPKKLSELLIYVLTRLKYHQNDVLLYKKHPTRQAREFLHIRAGFLVDPVWDFKTATGMWYDCGKMNLSSPRGLVFLENKTALHAALIIFLGILYVAALKVSRLAGSIRFGKLLL